MCARTHAGSGGRAYGISGAGEQPGYVRARTKARANARSHECSSASAAGWEPGVQHSVNDRGPMSLISKRSDSLWTRKLIYIYIYIYVINA